MTLLKTYISSILPLKAEMNLIGCWVIDYLFYMRTVIIKAGITGRLISKKLTGASLAHMSRRLIVGLLNIYRHPASVNIF